MRKYLIILLAGISGWALIGQAAQTSPTGASGTSKPGTAATPPPISDVDAQHYLKGQDLTDFLAAIKEISDGQAKMEQGTKDQNAKPDTNSITPVDVTALKTKGTAELKEGRAMVKEGQSKKDALIKTALANKDISNKNIQTTDAAKLQIATGQWPDVIHGMVAKLLTDVWNKTYKRVYLADVYAFAEPNYVAVPDLSDQVRQQIVQLDKDKKTFIVHDWSFKVGQENGHQVIAFPDRATALQGGGKAVVIVGEVLDEIRNGYALVSLRAVDLGNMRIISSQVAMLSVEPTLGKFLGLPAFRVLAKRNASVAGDKPADQPLIAVNMNLQDPTDIFSASKKTGYSFRVATAGHPDTLENRFALLMLKCYLLDQQSGINLSDEDFIVMAFSAEKPGDAAGVAADVGGVWTLPNLDSLSDSIELNPLKQRVFSSNVEKTVGKATIERDLPKLTPPSPEDLRAGGYK